MGRWAVVREGVVDTVIVWSGAVWSEQSPSGLRLDPGAEYVEIADGVACGRGWTRAGDGWAPPAPPVPTAEEAVAAVNEATLELIDAGAPHRGVRLPASRDGRADWIYLGLNADTVKAVLAPTVDGAALMLASPTEIRAAVNAVGTYALTIEGAGVMARSIAAARPEALDVVLAALRSEDPIAALQALA